MPTADEAEQMSKKVWERIHAIACLKYERPFYEFQHDINTACDTAIADLQAVLAKHSQ